ncbi:MAG: MFS transporter [Burkholderiales bacterium]|nr:MFS transporter [Anaerolineae bacterium]
MPEAQALQVLTPDGRLLFATRIVRLFAYGFLSVVLALYLTELRLDDDTIGVLLSWTLIGDAALSLWITTVADTLGRRRMLFISTGFMLLAGIVFALTGDILLLTLAAIIGTLSPSGGEVGPFLSIEQAALSQTTPDQQRTQIFAWYNLAGSLATAFGSLAGGGLSTLLQNAGSSPLESYRANVIGYALLSIILALLFTRLSAAVEAPKVTRAASEADSSFARLLDKRFGLHRSRGVVLKLSALFMLDSFGGSLVLQSILAYWFHVKFGVDAAALGGIFFGANLFAGLSALAAARIAARFGLINTMVWTHIPSNILLMLVPLMPTLELAIIVLLIRFSISQMDVPTRQSYIMAVVDPDERSAAAGITTIVRSLGSSFGPRITGALFAAGLFSAPFFIAGALKIVYDVALYRSFKAVKPLEENI